MFGLVLAGALPRACFNNEAIVLRVRSRQPEAVLSDNVRLEEPKYRWLVIEEPGVTLIPKQRVQPLQPAVQLNGG